MKVLLESKYFTIRWWSKSEWNIWKMPQSITYNIGKFQFVLYKNN
jgi:hypothetical protein